MNINVGDKIKLKKDIWDDGEDHHPPGWLAVKNEVLIVKAVREKSLAVAHDNVEDNSAFCIYEGEYELMPNV